MSRGGAERGGTKSEAGSRLWAVGTEPKAGLKLTSCEIMIWAKVGCLTDWATQAPRFLFYIKFIYLFWERECTNEWKRTTEWKGVGKGQRESQVGSMLSALSPRQDLISGTRRSWPEQRSRVRCLTDWATQVSQGPVISVISTLKVESLAERVFILLSLNSFYDLKCWHHSINLSWLYPWMTSLHSLMPQLHDFRVIFLNIYIYIHIYLMFIFERDKAREGEG